VRSGAVIIWLSAAVVVAEALFIILASPGADAHAYHSAALSAPYTHGVVRTRDAYLYSPAFVQVLAPFSLLPFEVFWILWVAMETAILVWLTGPVIAALALLPTPLSPVFTELWYGNIVMPMALVLALGLRWPAMWSFMLLTKVTPGIGLIWFAARGEWRKLGIAVLATSSIVAVSAALAPQLWVDWMRILVVNATGHPADSAVRLPGLPWRLGAAAVLIAIGARRNESRVLPPAIILALPVFWFASVSMLLVWVWQLRQAASQPPRTEPRFTRWWRVAQERIQRSSIG
jgi:hypothetical protein